MLITDIIEYFRQLANRHKDIACFRTGESYELNESGLSYPLLFLNTDFVTSYSETDNLADGYYVNLTFKLSVLVLSGEQQDAKPYNQIKMIGDAPQQDKDLAFTHQILNQVVTKAVVDFNEDYLNGWLLTGGAGGIALKRVINDDCDGWNVFLTIKANNDDECDIDNAFGEDLIDFGQDKNVIQTPNRSQYL